MIQFVASLLLSFCLLLSLLLNMSAPAWAQATAVPVTAPATARSPGPILILGDSLSAGFGLAAGESWPDLLMEKLRAEKFPHRVTNASISGETSAGGRTRLPALLRQWQPRIVVLALGANDGLRGLPVTQTRANLLAMTQAAKAAGARVLIIGMRVPPNYGPAYTEPFFALFSEVAQAEKTALLPFLLEPIALDTTAFQADRLHPTAAVQPTIRDHVWSALRPLLHARR